MSRKENRVIENQVLLDNMRKIQKASGLRQGAFFKTYLKDLPGAPVANTDAAADVALSEIMNGSRPVPVSFLPVYARLGHVSVDRLLTGQDWRPEDRPATYGDVLRLLSDLLSKKAASIQEGGAGISLQDPALVSMLAALADMDRLQRDGYGNYEDALEGLRRRTEMQTPLYDFSEDAAAAAYRIYAQETQVGQECNRDKLLALIRLTDTRSWPVYNRKGKKVSK